MTYILGPVSAQNASTLDIYRSANILVRQHGDGAPIHAAKRADEMPEQGDTPNNAGRPLRAIHSQFPLIPAVLALHPLRRRLWGWNRRVWLTPKSAAVDPERPFDTSHLVLAPMLEYHPAN